MRTILFSVLLSISSVFLYAQEDNEKELTLTEIWGEWAFSAESVRGLNSMNDGLHYTSLEAGKESIDIVKYSYKTGKQVTVVASSKDMIDPETKSTIRVEGYQFSGDETKLLIQTDIEHIYRHSTREKNFVYDLASKTIKPLSSEKQRYATFSPNGKKVAFVRNNNLFFVDLESGKETQVTKDGENNSIINGATDWVYEEEFAFDKAFFWSSDGNKIAYYKFDESNVKEFNMAIYGSLYPDQYKFKYPKAGEDNAMVSLHIYNLTEGKDLKADLGVDYEYIPRIKWTRDANMLSVQCMNRHQNKLDFLLVNASDGKANVLFTETTDTYIDITDNLTFLPNGNDFIWTSEKSGYNHIYLYSLESGEGKQITKGNYDVTSYLGMNEKTNLLYYTSAESSPLQRDLYSIKTDGSEKTKLSQKEGTNRAVFSKSFKYFINFHSDANTPAYITLHNAKGKEIRVLKDNARLKEKLGQYALSNKEFFSFETKDEVSLNGWMIKPPNFDPNKKYPVFMFVYGGPGSQTVQNSWGGTNQMWYHFLAQKGYIVVSVDNRGTGARGAAFKKITYKQLGYYETIDQIEAARYLSKQPYVNPDRIGIQGWSYGGYMSSLCLAKGNDLFKMAIAVAPVTNWRFYDSIYTERYMQTPQENADGYDDNSPINHVEKIKGKYLLVHGMADDNVHFQNATEMVTALVNANIPFDFMAYPNKNHGIYGGNTRLHLFTKMTDFVLNNL